MFLKQIKYIDSYFPAAVILLLAWNCGFLVASVQIELFTGLPNK